MRHLETPISTSRVGPGLIMVAAGALVCASASASILSTMTLDELGANDAWTFSYEGFVSDTTIAVTDVQGSFLFNGDIVATETEVDNQIFKATAMCGELNEGGAIENCLEAFEGQVTYELVDGVGLPYSTGGMTAALGLGDVTGVELDLTANLAEDLWQINSARIKGTTPIGNNATNTFDLVAIDCFGDGRLNPCGSFTFDTVTVDVDVEHAVAEPATVALIGMGLFGLGCRRRKTLG